MSTEFVQTLDERRVVLQTEVDQLTEALIFIDSVRSQFAQNADVLRKKTPKVKTSKISTVLRNRTRLRLPKKGTQGDTVGTRLMEVLSRTTPVTAQELYEKYFKRYGIKKQSVHGALYILEANGLAIKAPSVTGMRTQWLLAKTTTRTVNSNANGNQPVEGKHSYNGTHWTQRPGGTKKMSRASKKGWSKRHAKAAISPQDVLEM